MGVLVNGVWHEELADPSDSGGSNLTNVNQSPSYQQPSPSPSPSPSPNPGPGGAPPWLSDFQNLMGGISQGGADYYQIEKDKLTLMQQQFEQQKKQAELDMQLAKNADERAAAQLKIAQADQLLRENQFAQSKLEFEKNFTQRQIEYQGTLAKGLLDTASQLRGPKDWLKYSEFLGGGKNLMDQLYGGEANAAFGGEKGFSQPISIQDVINSLGAGQALNGQIGQPGQAGPIPTTATPGGAVVGGAVQQPIGAYTPGTSPGSAIDPRSYSTGAPGGGQSGVSGGQGGVPGAFNVPLPHQINPAQWDSMSQAARDLTMGLAEGGYTQQGSYTPEDYLRILNASRPMGTASRMTRSAYNAPVGSF